MFIFDFVISSALEEIMDWIYGKIVLFMQSLFSLMDGMGTEVLELPWVEAIVLLFTKFGWALYVVGMVVAVYECAIMYSQGKGSIRDSLLNMLWGFMSVSLFSVVPIRLYEACVRWEYLLGSAITGITLDDGFTSELDDFVSFINGSDFFLSASPASTVFCTFVLLLCGYAIIKVFFANIKRGGILVIQIAVGSMYMFSVPRGYKDGFLQWCKQIIALCLTAFLQSILLTAGLMIFRDHVLLGMGTMLAASEVPRICGQFGLDTSMKVNVMSSVYAVQSAINIGKSIAKAVGK